MKTSDREVVGLTQSEAVEAKACDGPCKATGFSRAARRRARRFVRRFLSRSRCVDCGENDPRLLDFDHVRGKKRRKISLMVSKGYSLDAIAHEIAKCEVRCVRCHRMRHLRDAARA